MNMQYGLLILALTIAAGARAEPEKPLEEPPLFDESAPQNPEELEPTVTIKKKKDMQIKEYRINGRLYMVEIVPAHGKPYYLVDSDGDGEMETRRDEMGPGFEVPSWVLFKW